MRRKWSYFLVPCTAAGLCILQPPPVCLWLRCESGWSFGHVSTVCFCSHVSACCILPPFFFLFQPYGCMKEFVSCFFSWVFSQRVLCVCDGIAACVWLCGCFLRVGYGMKNTACECCESIRVFLKALCPPSALFWYTVI